MRAELIGVGSELFEPGRRDTNAEWLVERLGRLGIQTAGHTRVEDDVVLVAALIRAAEGRSELVIVTGGLGPTEDDRTREAVATALGRPLERDDRQVTELRRRFNAIGRSFGPEQLKQADKPRGLEWIENPIGSAPGYLGRREGHLLCVLPGVPSEMKAMFESSLLPELSRRQAAAIVRVRLRIAGCTEPSVDRRIADLYERPRTAITILSGGHGIDLHLRVTGARPEAAREQLARLEAEIAERLGADLYGRGDETLAGVVGALLLSRGETVATAESCTAGLLGAELTTPAGASGWYRGGVVCYDDSLKVGLVGVAQETLDRHGAVSQAVARELACGVRRRCAADWGLGITGVAGPDGGSEAKPVGTVHLALAGATDCEHAALRLPGGRAAIRERSASRSLDLLRRRLHGTA